MTINHNFHVNVNAAVHYFNPKINHINCVGEVVLIKPSFTRKILIPMEIRLLKIVNKWKLVFYLKKRERKIDSVLLLHAANRNVLGYFYLNGPYNFWVNLF